MIRLTCKYGPAVVALEQAVRRGLFEVIGSPSPEVVHKVIAAALLSAGMPPAAKKFLARI